MIITCFSLLLRRNRRLLESYDTDDEAIAPQKENLPHAPQIQPPTKRIWSSSEVQPSPQRQPQPSIWPQKSPCLTEIPETPGTSVLDMSPTMQERSLGSSLRQAIDMPEPMPALPFHRAPSSARSSQITLQSPEHAVESLWQHDSLSPRVQTKHLPSNDPFQRRMWFFYFIS